MVLAEVVHTQQWRMNALVELLGLVAKAVFECCLVVEECSGWCFVQEAGHTFVLGMVQGPVEAEQVTCHVGLGSASALWDTSTYQ